MDPNAYQKLHTFWKLACSANEKPWQAPYFNVYFNDGSLFSDGEHLFSAVNQKTRRAFTISLSNREEAALSHFGDDDDPSDVELLQIWVSGIHRASQVVNLIDHWMVKNTEQSEMLYEISKYEAPQAVCILLQQENGTYLAVSRKDDPNDWGLPGGKVENNESLEEAIERETMEETGLQVRNLRIIFETFDKPYWVTTYTGEFSGTIRTTEAGRVQWVTKKELTKGSFGAYNQKLFDIYGLLQSSDCRGSA